MKRHAFSSSIISSRHVSLLRLFIDLKKQTKQNEAMMNKMLFVLRSGSVHTHTTDKTIVCAHTNLVRTYTYRNVHRHFNLWNHTSVN